MVTPWSSSGGVSAGTSVGGRQREEHTSPD